MAKRTVDARDIAAAAFARALGWTNVRRWEHYVEDLSLLVVWHEAEFRVKGRRLAWLQINRYPCQGFEHQAAVFSPTFRIFTNWHTMDLLKGKQAPEHEAERLRQWLDFSWYRTAERRKEFRKLNPECAGRTGRDWGPKRWEDIYKAPKSLTRAGGAR